MNYNQNSGYGRGLLDSVKAAIPTFGRIFVVMSSSDIADPNYQAWQEIAKSDPMGVVRFYTSIESAYDQVTSNNNDVIVLDGHSQHTLAAMLTVAKNRVHFFGMDGGDRLVQQGARIDLATAATDAAATITVTGTRCSFRNIKVENSGTHANSVAAMIDEGEGTLIKNCTIYKYTDLDQTGVADFICRSDCATYENVQFGFDTLVQTAARPTFLIANSGSTKMKGLRSRNCTFISASSSADKLHIKVNSTASLLFTNIFENPVLVNSISASQGAVQATVAAASASGLVEGMILFTSPHTNAASFSTTSDQFVVTMTPTSTTNAFEGKTPA